MFPRLAVTLLALPLCLRAVEPLPTGATAMVDLRAARIVALPEKNSATVLALTPEGLSRWDHRNRLLDGFALRPSAKQFWLAPNRTTLLTLHEKKLLCWDRIDWSQPKPFAEQSPTEFELDSSPTGPFAVSEGGSMLALPMPNRVALFDLHRRQWTLPLKTEMEPKGVAIAPNDRTLYVLASDSVLRVLSLSDRGEIEPNDTELWRKRLPQNDLKHLALSPDGFLIATASRGKTVLIDAVTGRHHRSFDRDFGEGDVSCLCFSPDGLLLASALSGTECRINVVDLMAGKVVANFKGHSSSIESMAFLDANTLATAGSDGKLIAWNLGPVPRAGQAKVSYRNAFRQLDSADAVTAVAAVRSLLDGGDAAVEAIRDGLDNSQELQTKIAKWIAQLESDDFRPRELARQNLLETGVRCEGQVREALKKHPSPEVDYRLKSILTRLEEEGKLLPPDGLYGESLTRLRAVYVLERMPGDQARTVLERIAKSNSASRDSIEARMALERRPR